MAKAKKTTKTTAQPKKMNAAQKIDLLEKTMALMSQKINILADEIDRLGQITQGLARRLNAAIEAGETGTISNDAIQNILVEKNVQQLEAQVSQLVENNILVLTDGEIGDKTFVVGRELNEDGKVVNPRAQFAFGTLKDPEVASNFEGKKTGDVLKMGEGMLSFEILEVYNIVEPQEVEEDFEETPIAEDVEDLGEE